MNVCDGQNPISNQLINITKKIKQQSSSTKISGTTASRRLCFHVQNDKYVIFFAAHTKFLLLLGLELLELVTGTSPVHTGAIAIPSLMMFYHQIMEPKKRERVSINYHATHEELFTSFKKRRSVYTNSGKSVLTIDYFQQTSLVNPTSIQVKDQTRPDPYACPLNLDLFKTISQDSNRIPSH